MKLKNLFAVNKLSLNVNKASFMIFGKKKNVPGISITINQENIERVYKINSWMQSSMISYHGKHKFNRLNPSQQKQHR